MGKYATISNDYRVLRLYPDGRFEKEVAPDDPLYAEAMDAMIRSFNRMHLEKYLDDEESRREIGCAVRSGIKSIVMTRTRKKDGRGVPYIRITAETCPGKLRLTQKVRDYLDGYLSDQFSEGWGETFFYPSRFRAADGTILAVE